MTAAIDPSSRVKLAEEPDFALGALAITPSACRVRAPGLDQRVEPRIMEVLIVLVRHAGQTVTRDQLIDACWGGRAVSDDAVSRAVAQVRSLARRIDPPPFAVETVPRIGFRLTPRAAEPAAATETATPPSTPAPDPAAADPPTPASRPRPAPRPQAALMAVVLAAVVAFAAIGWGVWSWLDEALASRPNGRVEVMGFTAPASDPGAAKVAEDISSTLIQVLTVGGVPTAGRPLARDAGGGEAELRIAGTVMREGETYVVQSQVLDRRTGLVLLSDRFVRRASDTDSVAADVAPKIGAPLHCAIEDRKASHKRVSAEAFSLYLNACDCVFGDDASFTRMLSTTRRLVKAAPGFSGAHAMHALAAAMVAMERTDTPEEAAALHAEARSAATEALRIDPRNGKAYSALAINEGVLSDRVKQDWFAEEQYIRKALAIDPEMPPALREYALLLRRVGRWNEATELIGGANASGDPRSNAGDTRAAMMMAAKGDLEGAEEQLRRLELSMRKPQQGMRWTIAFWWEDPRTALAKIPTLMNKEEQGTTLPCVERYLGDLIARNGAPGRGLPPACDSQNVSDWRARLLAREGDLDGAFAALRPPIPGDLVMLYYPEMRGVRADPRFWPLARDFGLVDYWRKSGHWPDFCAEPGLPIDCRQAAARVTGAPSVPSSTGGR